MDYHIVVCGGIAPDPLQTLEPIAGPSGPALKNELMLPSILDPWAACALYEAAHLSKKITLVSMSPKQKLQQVMMTLAQKASFELVVIDGPANGFVDSASVAEHLAGAIEKIPGLDKSKLLIFGGWESATRGAGTTMQMVGERLGITEQFQGVDELRPQPDGSLEVVERLEGGKRQISRCEGAPMLVGWATGTRPEPANQPQLGMQNMRSILPSLQKAAPAKPENTPYSAVTLPAQQRDTRIVKDMPAAQIARELVEWINA